ncbi:hypothetical protein SOVF_152700, partial [Spinacia oleracea]
LVCRDHHHHHYHQQPSVPREPPTRQQYPAPNKTESVNISSLEKALKMDIFSNAFSVLALEDADDPSTLSSTSAVSNTGEGGNKSKSSDDKLVVDNGNNKEQKLGLTVAEYKLPLVWIDLEMTGLNVEADRILEIACIITDGSLSKSVEGPDFVIHQSQECLEKMNDWCIDHHAASGKKGFTFVLYSTPYMSSCNV